MVGQGGGDSSRTPKHRKHLVFMDIQENGTAEFQSSKSLIGGQDLAYPIEFHPTTSNGQPTYDSMTQPNKPSPKETHQVPTTPKQSWG